MQPQFHISSQPERSAYDYLINTLQAYKANGIPMLLLCSGGSALQILQNSSNVDFADLLTVGVLDERFSNDPQINNFVQLSQTIFFQNAVAKGAQVISTLPLANENEKDLAARFEASLISWRKSHRNGKIIAILGMGEDGHTSGIEPHNNFLSQSDHWVVAYNAHTLVHPNRVTSTFKFLREAVDETIFFVKGEAKKAIFSKLFEHKADVNNLPARIIFQMKTVRIFSNIEINLIKKKLN